MLPLTRTRAADNLSHSPPDPALHPLRDLVRHLVRLLFESHSTRDGYDSCIIKALLRPHGIFIENCPTSRALRLLALHLISGMCAGARAEGCLAFHGTDSSHIRSAFVSIIVERGRARMISEGTLRDLCSFLSVRTDRSSLDEMTTALAAWPPEMPTQLNMKEFFGSLGRLTKAHLTPLLCHHGLLFPETLLEMRLAILHHLISGACKGGLASKLPGCTLWSSCLPPVDPESDSSAAILASIISRRLASDALLKTILSSLNLSFSAQDGYDELSGLLKTHLFSLHRGASVFQTISEHMARFSQPESIARAHSMWPECARDDVLHEIRSSFEQCLIDSFPGPRTVCSSCGVSVADSQSVSVPEDELDLSVLVVPPDWVDGGIWPGSETDLLLVEEGVTRSDMSETYRFCVPCDASIQWGLLPKFSLANHLFLGQVPDELQGLTVVEENMIALTRLKCMILQLKEDRNDSAGFLSQRAYTGHTIYFHQNIQGLANVLPPPIEEIIGHICVLFVGSHKPSQNFLRTHAKPLVVRAERVRAALLWLKTHNHLYQEIVINHTLLDSIELENGLTYPVEHVESSLFEDDPTSGYTRQDESETTATDRDGNIIFQNLMVSDLEGSPSSFEMKAAALRHLQQGRPFIQMGHVSIPETDYNNPSLFPSIFPTLYPYGFGGFEDPARVHAISFQLHLRHLLQLADRRFQEHPSFIFTAFNILQRREIMRRTQMRVKRSDFANKALMYSRITPDAIEHVSQMVSDGSSTSWAPGSPEQAVQTLMRDVQMVNSTVMGSNSARTAMREEIRSMIVSLGAPSLFITINPADLYNPLVRVLVGEEISLDSFPPAAGSNRAFFNQSQFIAKNPVVAAQFFDIYLTTFFSSVLAHCPGKDKRKGLFGYTKAFYGCAEAQGRGTLHCHSLVWLEGGLNPTEIKQRLISRQNLEFEQRLIAFLETNISSCIPTDPGPIGGVPSSDRHPCMVRPILRFEMESAQEFQARRAKDLHMLARVCQKHSHSPTCYKYCKDPAEQICRFGLDPSNHVPNTTVDYASGELRYQCLDGLVNPFNSVILELVRCNMDIKFIGSGQSAKAILYYITNYVSKSQLKMHVVYNALQTAIRKLQTPLPEDRSLADMSFKDQARIMLRKAANAIVSMQELSAQQVALYAIRGADNYTSHTFTRLFWRQFESHIDRTFPLPPTAGEDEDVGNPVSNPEPSDDEASVRITPHVGLVLKGSALTDYASRPLELDVLSLWDFVAHCHKTLLPKAPTHTTIGQLPDRTELPQPPVYHLPSDAITMHSLSNKTLRFTADHPEAASHGIKVRDYPHATIPVLIGPSIPRRDRPELRERYCRLMLLFFKPWRTANDLHEPTRSWATSFDLWFHANNPSFHHARVMDNIHLLHACRDSRDLEYKMRHRSHAPTVSPLHPSISTPSDLTIDGQQTEALDPTLPANPNDPIADLAAELLKENAAATLPVIKKGIIAGLFSLDYSLPDNTLSITDIAVGKAAAQDNGLSE